MGVDTTNKQRAICIHLAQELIVQELKEERRLPSIKEYADRFGVGLGTVQGAFQELKSSGAVTLNACGAQGTFLERADRKRLWELSGYGILVGLLPLDNNLGVKGLATGIYEAFTQFDLPIHILFARGSKNRTDILLRDKCDFSVMSGLALKYALGQGERLRKAAEVGQSIRRYGFLTRPGAPFGSETRVAYDSYSYEQEAVIRSLGKEQSAYGGCLGVQLADMVRVGEAESALVDCGTIQNPAEFDLHPLHGLSPYEQEALSRTAVVVREDHKPLEELLRLVFTGAPVEPVQEEVIRHRRFVKY